MIEFVFDKKFLESNIAPNKNYLQEKPFKTLKRTVHISEITSIESKFKTKNNLDSKYIF